MKLVKNQKGFTLIEMMIVLLVISVLLIITIPNVTKHNSKINSKGCDAFVKMVQAQVQSYELEHNKVPASVDELADEEYLEEKSCPNGEKIVISATGEVTSIKDPEGE